MANKTRNEKKQANKQSARQRRRRAAALTMRDMIPGGGVDRLLSQVYQGRGAPLRYPDGSDISTIAYRNYSRGLITTDNNGVAVQIFLPSRLIAAISSSFTVNGPTLTALGAFTDVSDFAQINASHAKFRVNAAYLRLGYVHNTFENQGRLAVKYFVSNASDLTTMPADLPTGYGQSALEMAYGVLRDGMTMTFPPVDISAHIFKGTASAIADHSYGYPACMVFVTGAKASTTVLEYEFVQELELIPDSGNYVARMAGEPPADNPAARKAIAEEYHALRGAGKIIQPTDSFESYADSARKYLQSMDPRLILRAIETGRSLYGMYGASRDIAGNGGFQMLE